MPLIFITAFKLTHMYEQSEEIKKVLQKLVVWFEMNDIPIEDDACGSLYILGDDFGKWKKRIFGWNELTGEFGIYNVNEWDAYDARRNKRYWKVKSIFPC
ncbi:MAG TPA: hypothetical protein DCY06_01640, partial [Bacteroidetes bacterium]|nr:hypothetical protein [Bacteroidota bacterium]